MPLGRTRQAVEVRVADDGVDGADPLDEGRVDHLRARAVLGLLGQDEAWIVGEAAVLVVVVVVDPGPQSLARARR